MALYKSTADNTYCVLLQLIAALRGKFGVSHLHRNKIFSYFKEIVAQFFILDSNQRRVYQQYVSCLGLLVVFEEDCC